MIVDCHTRIWNRPDQLGDFLSAGAGTAPLPLGPDDSLPQAGPPRHQTARQPVDVSIVHGFASGYLNARISNDIVVEYVQTDPDRLIGFAGIDPADPAGALEEIERARGELGMKGLSVSPAAQDVHPSDSRLEMIYERAEALSLPVCIDQGVCITRPCRMEYAQPVLLDQIARDYPKLKILVAHAGFPWFDETLVLLAKHQNVYAEVSWLIRQPLRAYQALLGAHQLGVLPKMLFGSGFPFFTPAECIEWLYGLNQFATGSLLPKIPRDALRGIVERNALELLGIPHEAPAAAVESTADAFEDEASLG